MRIRKRLAATALIAATSTTIASCGLGVEDLALPKPDPSEGGYTVTANFDTALNLPTDAKVKSGGNDIGVVRNISTQNFEAQVEMQIREDVEIPEGTVAELRQATPLGDVFISLNPPALGEAGPPIKDGGKLEREYTKAGTTVEQLLSQASLLINGGALTRAVEILNEVSSAVAGKDETLVNVVNRLTSMITTLNGRTEALDSTLNETTEFMNTLGNRKEELGRVADSFPGVISVAAENNQNLGDAVRSTTRMTDALGDFSNTSTEDLNTLLLSVDRLMESIDYWDTRLGGLMTTINRLEPLLDNSTESTAFSFELVLWGLSIGALYDSGSRLPDGQDLNLLVISMSYMLQKLYVRINGGQR